MSTEITITIDTQGNSTIAVKGVKGSGCKALTKEFEEGLGKTISDTKTKEYHEQQEVQIKARG